MNRSKYLLYVLFVLVFSCAPLCDCSNPHIPVVITIGAYFSDTKGKDLLDSTNVNHYKQREIQLQTKVKIDGIIKEVNYNEQGVKIWYDASTNKNTIDILIPTNHLKEPLETHITLSPSDIDTITYTFLNTNRPYIPDKLYYNKKLVWDVVNAPNDGLWPPITIVK